MSILNVALLSVMLTVVQMKATGAEASELRLQRGTSGLPAEARERTLRRYFEPWFEFSGNYHNNSHTITLRGHNNTHQTIIKTLAHMRA